jgi:hypothetical protein
MWKSRAKMSKVIPLRGGPVHLGVYIWSDDFFTGGHPEYVSSWLLVPGGASSCCFYLFREPCRGGRGGEGGAALVRGQVPRLPHLRGGGPSRQLHSPPQAAAQDRLRHVQVAHPHLRQQHRTAFATYR